MKHTPQVELAAGALLGEGPRWCADEQALYWIDILRPAVHRFTPGIGATGCWELPEKVGCIASLGDRQWLLALQSGLFRLDTGSGTLARLGRASHATPHHRFNDGAVDPCGRFWVGSMSEQGEPTGCLYRHDTPAEGVLYGADWGVPNGIGWSPDGATMYVTDSRHKVIWAYDYTLETGEPRTRRVLARFDDGVPDGLAVDAEGCVWSAVWDGWRIVRLDPQGREMARIALPVQRPTSVAFGGAKLTTLYVTSASINVLPGAGAALAGALFSLDAPAPGLAARPAVLASAGAAA